MRLAYADPPYPGRSHLYAGHPDYAGEVDHAQLVTALERYDGWALSTNSDSLRDVLALCPAGSQVAAWVRTNAPPFNPNGLGSVRSWEPVIYSPARVERFGPARVRDVVSCGAPTGTIGVGLTGAKPAAFCRWLFALMGADCDDALDDLYPGTGGVADEWESWRRAPQLFGSALGGPRSGEHLPPQAEALIAAPKSSPGHSSGAAIRGETSGGQ